MSNPFLPPPGATRQGQTNSKNCPGAKYEVTSVEFIPPPGCFQPPPEGPLGMPWTYEKPSKSSRRFGRNFRFDDLTKSFQELGGDVSDTSKSFFQDLGNAADAVNEGFQKASDVVRDGAGGVLEVAGALNESKSRLEDAVLDLGTALQERVDDSVKNPINRGLKEMDKTTGTTSLFDLDTFLGRTGDYYIDARLGIRYSFWREKYTLFEGKAGVLCAVTEGNFHTDVRFRLSPEKAKDQGLTADAGAGIFVGGEWQIDGDILGGFGEVLLDGLVLKGGLQAEYRIGDGARTDWVIGFEYTVGN